MYISPKMLQDEHACPAEYSLFKDLFGEGVTVTTELCLQYAADFDWNWAALHLLPLEDYRTYQRLTYRQRAEYIRDHIRQRQRVEYNHSAWLTWKTHCAAMFAQLATK